MRTLKLESPNYEEKCSHTDYTKIGFFLRRTHIDELLQLLNIFIGHENPIGKNSEVSLIISKFVSPFSDNSYIGVLGPTRQNYLRVMSLVKYAGRMLEETL